MVLPGSIAVHPLHGGIGATTLAAQLITALSQQKRRVLAVGLDASCALAALLGHPCGSDGAPLAAALLEGTPLTPTQRTSEPTLISGGRATHPAIARLYAGTLSNRDLIRVLGPIAANHDITILDTTHLGYHYRRSLAHAAETMIVPVGPDPPDRDSILELEFLASPDTPVALLGLAMIGLDSRASALRAHIRAIFESAISPPIPVFKTVIRASRKVANQLRSDGISVFDYAARVEQERRTDPDPRRHQFVDVGVTLAAEYTNLTTEILDRHQLLKGTQ